MKSMETSNGIATNADVYYLGEHIGFWEDDGCSIIPLTTFDVNKVGRFIVENHPEYVRSIGYDDDSDIVPGLLVSMLLCQIADDIDSMSDEK